MRNYQDPTQIDKLYQTQAEGDEVRTVLYECLDNLISRGERLDDLITKTSELSAQSKLFYKTVKRHNQCCKAY